MEATTTKPDSFNHFVKFVEMIDVVNPVAIFVGGDQLVHVIGVALEHVPYMEKFVQDTDLMSWLTPKLRRCPRFVAPK